MRARVSMMSDALMWSKSALSLTTTLTLAQIFSATNVSCQVLQQQQQHHVVVDRAAPESYLTTSSGHSGTMNLVSGPCGWKHYQ